MKTITFLNEKGGVGKTTLAVTLAAGLALRGKTVVMIDADPQGHTTIAFGMKKEPSFHDLVIRKSPFDKISYMIPKERYVPAGYIDQVKGRLILIPGDKETRTIAQNTDDAFGIIERVAEIIDYVDYVIFDTSPTPSLLHSMIYMATDGIIYPTQLEALSFDGLVSSMGNRRNYDAVRSQYGLPLTEILAVIPCRTRLKTLEHSSNMRNLLRTFGPEKVWRPIHERVAWAEAMGAKKSIFAHHPTSKAAEDGWRLIEQFENTVKAYV